MASGIVVQILPLTFSPLPVASHVVDQRSPLEKKRGAEEKPHLTFEQGLERMRQAWIGELEEESS